LRIACYNDVALLLQSNILNENQYINQLLTIILPNAQVIVLPIQLPIYRRCYKEYKMDIHDYLVIFSRCSRLTVTQQPWMVSYASVTKISN